MRQKILIVAPDFAPPLNESWAKTVAMRAEMLNADVVGTSYFTKVWSCRGNYLIFNSSKLVRYLLFLPYVVYAQRRYSYILFENMIPRSFFIYLIYRLIGLGIIDQGKCISVSRLVHKWIERENRRTMYCIKHVLPKLKCFLVNDEDENRELTYLNPAFQNIITVFPGIDVQRFKESTIQMSKLSTFVFLFASAPMGRNNYNEEFHDKGVFLLLEAFKRFIENRKAMLYLLWRNSYYIELCSLISGLGIQDRVEIINDTVDIREYFKESHVTILPVENMQRTPPYPRSIMESVAIGRPVIVSNRMKISGIIAQEECGIVTSPNVEGLYGAMERAFVEYERLKVNCRITAEKYFDYDRNLRPFLLMIES